MQVSEQDKDKVRRALEGLRKNLEAARDRERSEIRAFSEIDAKVVEVCGCRSPYSMRSR